jgi:cell division protein FtsW (lipid II flippase)
MTIARQRRDLELGLVALAALVTVSLYVLTALGTIASLPANIGFFLTAVVVLMLVTTLATRRFTPGADPFLLPLAVVLNGIGYVVIARIDTDLASKQAVWTAVGVGALVVTLALVRRPADLSRFTWTLGLVGIALLLLPLVPGLGFAVNGSRLWISVGPINVQPGEVAKIALAIFSAAYLVERRELLALATWKVGPVWLPEPRHVLPLVAAWAASLVVLIGQRDLGSALLFFTLFVVMVWVATERVSYLVLGTVLFAIGAVAAWRLVDTVQDRVAIWIDPWSDALGKGYQLVQATYALAWGGLTGTGPGLGDPGRIPEAQNDFIFAAIGEELGLAGATAILAAYLLFVGAGLRIAVRAERPFEKLLAAGLTTIVGVQAFLICAGVVRVLPLTGVTLPFVSYGGSSLVANYVIVALLLRISNSTAERLGEVEPRAVGGGRFRRRLDPDSVPVAAPAPAEVVP